MALTAMTASREAQIARQASDETEVLADHVLVARSKRGDREAFCALVDRYFRTTFVAAYAILGNREDAEDAAQEAMVKAYRHIRSLKEADKVEAWLRRIAQQEAYGRIRKLSRLRRLLGRLTFERQSEPLVAEEGKERRTYHRELFEHSLSMLSDKARRIVVMHYMEGLTCDEVADRLGLSAGSVKSHLFKARDKMYRGLAAVGVASVEDL